MSEAYATFLPCVRTSIQVTNIASGGVIVRTPKCGVSVCISIYRKTIRDRQILIEES